MTRIQKTMFLLISVVVVAVGAVLYTLYRGDTKKDSPIVFSQNQMLLELWNDNKASNIEKGSNRTIDKQQDNISTSEGQSYTMLRAVWVDDKTTFDQSWKWTKDNLQRDDSLMSWKFGKLPNSDDYGIQDTIGGQNTASDGDSDIALSLLMAYSRWRDDDYLYDAKAIISSMWEKEVVSIQGKPVFVANDLERFNKEKVIVNPSYFSPYAYKIFAKVDTKHDWTALADNSYKILEQVSDQKLNTKSSAGLPPDWITVNRKSGDIKASDAPNLTTNFSYDAIRTPWRLALDWQWFKDPRAKTILSKYSFLKDQWNQNQKIVSTYAHDGTAMVDYDSPAIYGTTIGYFKVIEPSLAKEVYEKKLVTNYDPDEQKYKTSLPYYDENWTWFGIALMVDALPNLTEINQ